MSGTSLPVAAPDVAEDTRAFWTAAGQARLLLRRCDHCGHTIWYPRPYCPDCGSLSTSWFEASGHGTVYSFTVVHRTGLKGWSDSVPYVVAYVELAEGCRVLTNIVNCDLDSVSIGMPVKVVFDEAGGEYGLYRFEPSGNKSAPEQS